MNQNNVVSALVGAFVGFLITIATVMVMQGEFERQARVKALTEA